MPIKLLIKFITALNSNVSPRQMANGFALGAILGLSPFVSPQGILLLLLIYFLQVNIPMAFIGMAVYKLIGIFLAYPAHVTGKSILTSKALYGLFTYLYNIPIVPWSKFNNTVIMGSFIIALVLYAPNFFIGKYFVLLYRKYILKYIEKSKLIKFLKGSKVFKLYQKYSQIKGEL